MTGESDQDLIHAYARDRSQEAFGELVHRHVDLVHSTAFRVLRDSSLAEDVTQRVFMALAQHAARLQNRTALTGWLHETARNFAVSTVRSEERRRLREQASAFMNINDSTEADDVWKQIAPHLDDALAQLSGGDRDVVLWRYFERKTAAQIGDRLGLSGAAAQKRVARALDRLRTILAERGLATPAVGLAVLLSSQAVQSAPAGLAASALAAAGTVAPVLSATSTLGIIMASTKAKIGLGAVLAASVITTPLVLQHQHIARQRDEIAFLEQQIPELDRLREEVKELTAIDRANAEQAERDRAELARLRAESIALKTRAMEAAQSQSAVTKPASTEPPLMGIENWAHVGFATPSASLQTLNWARARGDTNVIANSLAWSDEETRAKLESMFAALPESMRSRYGSPDAYMLSFFTNPTSDDRKLVSYRILEENIVGNDANVLAEWRLANGHTSTNAVHYVRIGDDWRQALKFDDRGRNKVSVPPQAEGGNPSPVPSTDR